MQLLPFFFQVTFTSDLDLHMKLFQLIYMQIKSCLKVCALITTWHYLLMFLWLGKEKKNKFELLLRPLAAKLLSPQAKPCSFSPVLPSSLGLLKSEVCLTLKESSEFKVDLKLGKHFFSC